LVKSLAIHHKHLPPEHPEIATSYNNIGCNYSRLYQYDLAMQYHGQSLQIRLKSLPSQHPEVAMSYKNIGFVYEMKGEWK